MRKWYPALLVAASVIVSVIAYSRLPAQVPTHWDIHGHVTRTGPRLVVVVLFPALLLFLWGIMRLLPLVDPRRANYALMQGTYDLVVNLVLTIVAVLHYIVIAPMLGLPLPLASDRLIPMVIGVALVVLGGALPRAQPNWWFGIRTPWTLSNDRVWARTHRAGGYVVAAVGAIAFAAGLFRVAIAGVALGVLAAVVALGLIAYSYVVWRQETSR